ncbi:macrophage mannose receptor 1-like [Hyla sarda]|uniref:macrophage mannose receptor 1-like n=1 Tax=Hyla sarda TaxID=327740 RepID=UPI0024C3D9DB|nr:macrophage mannose receptor 1-like [Hyla sarda]
MVITVSYQTPGMIMDGISFPVNTTWDNTMCNSWRYSWVQVEVSAGSHYIQQLWYHDLWAVSYSFSSNMTVASTMAGNTSDSFNFYGTNTICFCQDSPQSTKSPVSKSSAPTVAPTVAPTYTSQTSTSCQGDMADIYIVMMSLAWWDALRYCRLHYTDLFSVPDSSTQGLVAGAIRNITGQSAGLWIGLKRHRVWGYLYWTDGEPTDYINWGEDEPVDPWSNMCTAMAPDKNFTWSNQCCDIKLKFICY